MFVIGLLTAARRCSIIYKLLDELSMKLVQAAPKVQEEIVVGKLDVLATFHASVKKSVHKAGKIPVAGCKVCSPNIKACHCLFPVSYTMTHSELG
jgi:translation initiation factor IF-2